METLRYSLRQHVKMKNIGWLREIAKQGVKVASLDDMPTVAAFAAPYWEAFVVLSERRMWTDDGRPAFIPMSEILAYVQFNGWDDEWEREMLFSVISTLDKEYVSYKSEIAKKNAEDNARKAKQQRGLR